MIHPNGVLRFDAGALADGLGLPVEEACEFFRDGRRGQPLMVRRLSRELEGFGWGLIDRDGGGTLFRDAAGAFWELRAVTTELSLAPSRMKGTGRRFEPGNFVAYMAHLGGVIAVDVEGFPACRYWMLSSATLADWLGRGLLGGRGALMRADARRELEGLPV